jgi:hypothetical protein
VLVDGKTASTAKVKNGWMEAGTILIKTHSQSLLGETLGRVKRLFLSPGGALVRGGGGGMLHFSLGGKGDLEGAHSIIPWSRRKGENTKVRMVLTSVEAEVTGFPGISLSIFDVFLASIVRFLLLTF